MPVVNIIMGLTLLLFGRRLFWLFVAFSGFMVGFQFGSMIILYNPQWIQVAVALGVGIVSALLAIMLQRIGFVIAGFLAGFYMVLMATQAFGFSDISVILLLSGGAVGAVAGYIFIDWAIIVLSAIIGASLIVNVLIGVLRLSPAINIISFMILSITGALFQMRLEDKPDGN